MNLEVTQNAFKRIEQILANDQTIPRILRIAVEGGGCSGFMYKYEFVSNAQEDDYVITKDSIKVIVDPTSMGFMKECVVDFIEELTGSYFQISNPNATARCGCNNSFSI
jgi:iron-sulfur cluster assembly accessory protein